MAGKKIQFDVLALAKAEGFDEAGRKIKKLSDDGDKDLKILSTAIVSLAPAMLPIAAGAAGLGAGFVAAAGAGLLAFLGLRKEWQAGTLQSTALGKQISGLQKNIDTLETTAANGAMPGFARALQAVNGVMPTLNRDTAFYSVTAGDIASNTGVALVALFRDIRPLIQDATTVLDKGSHALANWATTSDGPKKFVSYAQQELPVVVSLIQNLATTVGHLIQGFAPLGGSSLQILIAFSRAVNAIPISVLQALAPAIAAIKVANTVSAGVDKLGKSLEKFVVVEKTAEGATRSFQLSALGSVSVLAMVAIGLGELIKKLTGLGNGNDEFGKTLKSVKDEQSAFAQALEQSNGKVDESVRQVAALTAENTGLADSSSKIGVNLTQLTNGITGTNAQYQALYNTMKDHGASDGLLMDLQLQRNAFLNGTGEAKNYDAAQKAAKLSTQGLTDAQRQQADQAFSLTTQLGFLNDALDTLSNNTIDADQIELRFKDNMAGITDLVKKNGTTLDENTAKGRANREWMLTQIQTINQHAAAEAKRTGSTRAATAVISSDTAQLYKNGEAAGFTKSQIDSMIKKYAATPKQVTTKINADTAKALGNIKGIQGAIAALHDRTITVREYLDYVETHYVIQKTVGGTYGEHGGPGGYTGGLFTGSKFKRFSIGGPVTGPGGSHSDRVLARLSAGEYVMNAASTAQFLPLLQRMNNHLPIQSAMPSGGAYGASRGNSSGQEPIQLVISFEGADSEFLAFMRKTIRVRGGNVQTVLGR